MTDPHTEATESRVTVTCAECGTQLDLYAATTQVCGCGLTETFHGTLTIHTPTHQAET